MTKNLTAARVAASVTGACSLVLGLLSITGPSVPDEHWGARGALVNALGLVAFAAMILALVLLSPLLALGPLGRLARGASQVGLGLMVAESVASQIHGGNILGGVFFLGLLLTLCGLLLIAVGGLRRRRWLAPVPFLALLIGIGAGDRGGFLILGLAWVALAWAHDPSARTTSEAYGVPGPADR